MIETGDGAEIRVDGRGYAQRERRDERHWRVAATLRFHAGDQRYPWLDGALGFSEGEFDADWQRARYRGYATLNGKRNRSVQDRVESEDSNMTEVE